MPPMVRRYRPVHKIYSAYQNLRKLKGPKHWYAGSNYFNNQASFNFRTNNYRRSKVSFLPKYFWVGLGCGMFLGTILEVHGDSTSKLNAFMDLGHLSFVFNGLYYVCQLS